MRVVPPLVYLFCEEDGADYGAGNSPGKGEAAEGFGDAVLVEDLFAGPGEGVAVASAFGVHFGDFDEEGWSE